MILEAISAATTIACLIVILEALAAIMLGAEKVYLYEPNLAIATLEALIVGATLIYTCHKLVKALIAIRGRIKHE